MTIQNQWATALKKGQYRARQSVNDTERERQLKEAIVYYKKQLIDAARRKAEDETDGLLQKLIQLRGELCAHALAKSKERTRHLKAYYTDCYRLAHAVQLLLKP